MFRKPFNVKKNTNLRNSDTRKLFQRLQEEVKDDLPTIDKKSQVAQVKLVNFNGDPMNVYLCDKVPMFFDFSDTGCLYPTVFYMWKFPLAYPVLLVHEPVLQYLENGADLMLAGVVKGDKFKFPNVRRGGPVAIALYSSGRNEVIGPIAVGCSLMSSQEMIDCGFQGKGVQVLHVFRDHLWEFGPRGQPSTLSIEEFNGDVGLSESQEEANDASNLEHNQETPATTAESHSDEKCDDDIADEPMESLLTRCFLAGLKHRLKKSGPLPMDIGQFYTQCVLACVPDGRKLEMKKTKFKKFGNFVQEINSNDNGEIIKINKKNKGAEMITEVNWAHELLKRFELTDEKITDDVVVDGEKFEPPTIHEYASVTEPVLPLLQETGTRVSKGDLITTPQLREFITHYVKKNELNAGKSVRIDPLLSQVSRIKTDTSDWNTLIQTIQSKMTKTWVIRWPDGREFIRKIHSPKIEFKIENRSGNKKVTLINNLKVFGIDIKTICHQIMTGVATSVTSSAEAINCEGPQVLVQGNQICFISDLLMNKYGLDKKYIVGMDLAPKKRR